MKIFRSVYTRLAIAGLVLMLAAFFMGADTTYYWNLSGLHSAKTSEQQEQSISGSLSALSNAGVDSHNRHILQGNMEPFDTLNLDVGSGRVEIIASDHYGVEIASKNFSNITCESEGGVLKLRQRWGFVWKVFNVGMYGDEDSIKIFLPRDAKLKDAHLQLSSGKIIVEQLDSKAFDLELSSGSVDLHKIVTDALKIKCLSGDIRVTGATAQTAELSLSSGWIDTTDMHTQGASVSVASGTIKMAGKFLGETNIKVFSGNIVMQIDEQREVYSYQTSVTSGSIRIDGKQNPGSLFNAQAPNILDVHVTSGDVRINFTKP